MKNKYRVVYYEYQSGFVPQIKRWWFPFWCQLGFIVWSTPENAENYIRFKRFRKEIK